MTRRMLVGLLAALTVGAGASCSKVDPREVDSLRTRLESLEKTVEGLPLSDVPVASGDIYLKQQGNACKVDRKTPDPISLKPSQWVVWTVHNPCNRSAEFEFFDPQPKQGNGSNQQNPLAAVIAGVIPPMSDTGSVLWRVKTKEQLAPPSGHPKDRWTYKWKVNNAVQQDPELEVEY
jgi:hypothetical protein